MDGADVDEVIKCVVRVIMETYGVYFKLKWNSLEFFTEGSLTRYMGHGWTRSLLKETWIYMGFIGLKPLGIWAYTGHLVRQLSWRDA